jgi:hypothetical protein
MLKLIKASILSVLLPVISVSALALEPISEQDLSNQTGQAGAKLDLNLQLNQNPETGNFECADLAYCRLAFSPNNRSGKWLVLKGLQGQIAFEGMRIDGATDIGGTGNSGLKLTFNNVASGNVAANTMSPIRIRNLGFSALSFEQDVAGTPGYLNRTTYAAGPGVTAFDVGRERGFIGLDINGNLDVTGSLTIFNFTP